MRVAVLGGGYAGLVLTRRLEADLPADSEIVVVDESGTHLVQHELHRVLRRPAFASDITVPLERVFDRARVVEARVTGVDRDARTVSLDDGTSVDYDVCAVCLGADTEFYGVPGAADHATPFKRLSHAHAVREATLRTVAAGGGAVVVVGAGLSGVQVAGELAALVREEGAAGDVGVHLLEQEATVAPAFPAHFRRSVRESLVEAGVEVHTDTRVERVAPDGVTVRADRDAVDVDADAVVWTGGVRGPDALGGDRPPVRASLAVDDRTYVLGDAARVVDADGDAVPASAQAAVREARVAAANIAAVVRQESDDGFRPRPERFRFDSPGWVVSVGDDAVAQVGPSVFRGASADVLKDSVGVGYLATSGAVREAVALARAEFRPGQ